MIFGLTDEPIPFMYNKNTGMELEEEKISILRFSIMNQSYWVIGSAIGGLAGSFLPSIRKGSTLP